MQGREPNRFKLKRHFLLKCRAKAVPASVYRSAG
jgi:hypothetical protein